MGKKASTRAWSTAFTRGGKHPQTPRCAVVPMDLHRSSTLRPVADSLAEEMRLRMAKPFPDSVEKGLDYERILRIARLTLAA